MAYVGLARRARVAGPTDEPGLALPGGASGAEGAEGAEAATGTQASRL